MKLSGFKPNIFTSLKGYTGQQLVKDIVSGIIVAIIALPLSIALALASGVSPEQGIYTAIIAGFIISFLGGSRVQIAGPTAAFATIVAGIVSKDGMEGLITATIIAGVMLILMGVLRLGTLIKFIPFTITTGFTAGIAVTIAIGQIKDFLGLTYASGTVNIETIEKIGNIFKFIGTFNWQAFLVGAVCLAILIVWPKISKMIPGSLIAVLAGIAMVKLIGMNVNTIGDLYTIKSGLPSFHFPSLSFSSIQAQLGNGLTIAILAAIESLLSAVVADGMIDAKHSSNTELVAQGLGNIASVLFGGIPATGAIARTAANIKNGGRTPIAGMVHSVVLFIVLIFLMPYASLIPMPAIAAILFSVAYNMSGWRTFVRIIKKAPKSDIFVLAATFVLTVIFDLVVAIVFGMIASFVLFIKRMNQESNIRGWKYYNADDLETAADLEGGIDLEIIPDYVEVYEATGPMFFGTTEHISNIIIPKGTRVLVMRMRSVPSIDVSAMRVLDQLHERCRKKHIEIIFSHVNEQPYKAMERAGFVETVGSSHFCPNITKALEMAEIIGKEMEAQSEKEA